MEFGFVIKIEFNFQFYNKLFSEGQTLEFNGIVSSSNTYDSTSDVVRIVTNEPLVWSMGINTLL